MDIALRDMGFDNAMVSAIHDMMEMMEQDPGDHEKPHHPSRAYIRDTKAMKSTPADVVELPNAYTFVVDMPGLKSDQINVHIEDDNVLVVSGERRRREKEEGVKYLRMERRFGKLLKKFVLPDNANKEKVSAVYEDGVLTVAVEKSPPPEPKKPRVIEVRIGGGGEGSRQQEAVGGAVRDRGGEGLVKEAATKTDVGSWHESDASHGEAPQQS